jgi:hypothetical protein
MLTGQDLFGLFSHIPLYPEGHLRRIGFFGQITSYHPTMIERFAGQLIIFTSPGPMTAMMKN